jgi:hypothetical protein
MCAFSTTCCKEIVDSEIATYSPVKLLQAFLQCGGTILRFCVIRSPHPNNNAAHIEVLRARGDGPRGGSRSSVVPFVRFPSGGGGQRLDPRLWSCES